MDTAHASDADDLVDVLSDIDDVDIDETTARECFRIWEAWRQTHASDTRIIVLPHWYVRREYAETATPILFGEVEYDNEQKGAVLFDNVHWIDTNICKNEAFDYVELSDTVYQVDLTTDGDAHVDDPGMAWIPRKLMDVVAYRDAQPADSITNLHSP